MVSQPQDTPFGLDPNVAAGLAYLFGLIGGIVMLVGGGTNKFVKWAACQSITLFVGVFIVFWVLGWIFVFTAFLGMLIMPIWWIVRLGTVILWLYLTITAFQGKEVRLPLIADLTQSIFKSVLAA